MSVATTHDVDFLKEEERALSAARMEAELERLRTEQAMLKRLRQDIESGTETKRAIGLFLLGAVIALGAVVVASFLPSLL
ncbi:MAG: hypothetical protein AB7S99_15665 [Pseudodonghicola sp.]